MTSAWEPVAHTPVRPSLQAMHAAAAPPSLADSLDELEEVLVRFNTDLEHFAERVAPLLHPVEDEGLPQLVEVERVDTAAPAVTRVVDVRRQLNAMHEQLFEIASRIAL